MAEAGAPSSVRLSSGHLLTARAAEQLALAAATLVLAQRLSPSAFAPVGVVLVVNSLAITIADLGVGLRALRLDAGALVGRESIRLVRRVNLGLTVIAATAGALVGGESGAVIGISGCLWLLAAEANIRKAVALRWGETARVAKAEVGGAAALAVGVLLAWGRPASALAWVSIGLAAKHLLEAGHLRSWRRAFGMAERERDWLGVWGSQALAFAIGNVDYLVVGALLGARALAIYTVAYRVANAVPSQVAFVAGRSITVDLTSGRLEDRQQRYERYCFVLFGAGAFGALAVLGSSWALSSFLGPAWTGTGWTLAVLALAAPWRAVLGTAGTLALISGGAGHLVRWETVRLVAVGLALVAAGLADLRIFLAVVVLIPVVSTVLYHRMAGALAAVRPWRPLRPLAVATVVLLVALLALASSGLGQVA